jgi:transcriptional regulator with XRE-family HTH domain
MQTGRPSKTKRTEFGERLCEMRERAGLSQQQLAERVGVSQRAYSYWERYSVTLRPDQLLKLASALSISVEELVGSAQTKRKGAGPAGKMRQLFEEASKLPRSKQQQIAAVLEAFIAQHSER